MKRLVEMRTFAILVVLARIAAADPPPSPPPTPAHPWSWTVLVSELGTGGEKDDVILGAEFRVRRSTEGNLEPATISVGVESRKDHPTEPYIMFGADTLHYIHPMTNRESRGMTFADLHVGIGGGYDHGGFVLGRLSAGVMFARIASGHYYAGYATMNRYRLSSQADVVLEVKASSGELRVAVGIELDPTRIVQDFVKLWW